METQETIIKAIAEKLSVTPADIDRTATLREDLGLGPIDLNDLLTSLCAEFDITLSPEDISELQTVQDLVEIIEDNML